jgi:hypothetical protein
MMISRAGQPTHRLLVKMFHREQYAPGELVAYHGEPNWKFEPLDEAAAEDWRREVAAQKRVLAENLRTGHTLRPPLSPAEKAEVLRQRKMLGQPIRIA